MIIYYILYTISFIEELLRNSEDEYTVHFIVFYSCKIQIGYIIKKELTFMNLENLKILIIISNSLITILEKFQK